MTKLIGLRVSEVRFQNVNFTLLTGNIFGATYHYHLFFKLGQKLFAPTPLEKWVIIVTKRDSDGIENLIKVMQKVSTPLGFNISRPSEV